MNNYLKKNISKFKTASEKYKPELDKLKLLFIAESPPYVNPNEELRYFYFEKLFKYDYLFKCISEVILPNDLIKLKNNLIEKKDLLNNLKNKGCFLIDAVDFPVNQLPDKEADEIITGKFDNLLDDINKIINSRTKIILIKENICNIFLEKKTKVKFEVLNPGFSNYKWKNNYRSNPELLPFPTAGWQREFREKLLELISEFKVLN